MTMISVVVLMIFLLCNQYPEDSLASSRRKPHFVPAEGSGEWVETTDHRATRGAWRSRVGRRLGEA